MWRGKGWGRVIHAATAKLASRPAAHHEWSGGGTKPVYFLAIKGEELSFAAGSIEVGVADKLVLGSDRPTGGFEHSGH